MLKTHSKKYFLLRNSFLIVRARDFVGILTFESILVFGATKNRCSPKRENWWFCDFDMHVEANATRKVAQTLQKWYTREYFKSWEFQKKPPGHWGSQNYFRSALTLWNRLFHPWGRKSRIFSSKISKKLTRILLREYFLLKIGINVHYDHINTWCEGNSKLLMSLYFQMLSLRVT